MTYFSVIIKKGQVDILSFKDVESAEDVEHQMTAHGMSSVSVGDIDEGGHLVVYFDPACMEIAKTG